MRRNVISDFKVFCYMFKSFKNLILPVQESKLWTYIQCKQICTTEYFISRVEEKS